MIKYGNGLAKNHFDEPTFKTTGAQSTEDAAP